eukprot:1009223-Amphidinium_carterae.1
MRLHGYHMSAADSVSVEGRGPGGPLGVLLRPAAPPTPCTPPPLSLPALALHSLRSYHSHSCSELLPDSSYC